MSANTTLVFSDFSDDTRMANHTDAEQVPETLCREYGRKMALFALVLCVGRNHANDGGPRATPTLATIG